MFQIDECIEYERVQQFATEVSRIPPEIRELFDQHFKGDKSDDYYAGLLAGFANSLQLSNSGHVNCIAHLGFLVAYTADRIAQRG